MALNGYLILALILSVIVIAYLVTKLRNIKKQLAFIVEATNDIKGGNLNRRVLVNERYDATALL